AKKTTAGNDMQSVIIVMGSFYRFFVTILKSGTRSCRLSFSKRVATRRKCLIQLKVRSTRLRAW
ncbi:12654_t:CDS:1, partial [Cetraspora pellucida]